MRHLIAAFLVMPLPLSAQTLDVVEGQLLAGWRDGALHHAGLALRLKPGWKTYWRAPGDAGIPPLFDWSGSENLAGVQVLYPAPQVFDQLGMRSLGYVGAVTFPLAVTPADPSRPVRLRGVVDLGVCEDICVPVRMELSGTLPAGGTADARITAARAALPLSATDANVQQVDCLFEPIDDGLRLTAAIDMPSLGGDETVAVEADVPGLWVSEPETTRSGDRMTLQADLVPPAAEPFFLARDAVRFTVIGGGHAVDIQGCG